MTEPDPYADDPFFRRVFDGDWNACIGRQGQEENYLDGYIEAAIELVDAIIDRKLFAKRDTRCYRSYTTHGTQSSWR